MMSNKPAVMGFGIRFISGFTVGFEILPIEGVYFQLQLGIVELVFFNENIIEED